jgi:hypothetical protein
LSDFKKDTKGEESAFEKLLRTFYGLPYQIRDNGEFSIMVEMADYYCALPSFSRSLNNALYESPYFVSTIYEYSVTLLPIAAKLRHRILYKECMIYLSGKEAHFGQIQDVHLKQLVRASYNKICAKVVKFQTKLMEYTGYYGSAANDHISELAEECWDNPLDSVLPKLYRKFLDRDYGLAGRGLRVALDDLLENKLTFDRSAVAGGDYPFNEYFLCATVEDEDLPWDPTETDW